MRVIGRTRGGRVRRTAGAVDGNSRTLRVSRPVKTYAERDGKNESDGIRERYEKKKNKKRARRSTAGGGGGALWGGGGGGGE